MRWWSTTLYHLLSEHFTIDKLDKACPPPSIVFAFEAGRLWPYVHVFSLDKNAGSVASPLVLVYYVRQWAGLERLKNEHEVGKMLAGECEGNGRVQWSSTCICRRRWWWYGVPPRLASACFALDMGTGVLSSSPIRILRLTRMLDSVGRLQFAFDKVKGHRLPTGFLFH